MMRAINAGLALLLLRRLLVLLLATLESVVVEQLFDEVDVREQHTATAVALQPKLLQRLTFIVLSFLHEVKKALPLVPNYLPAREAAHRDDHLGEGAVVHHCEHSLGIDWWTKSCGGLLAGPCRGR